MKIKTKNLVMLLILVLVFPLILNINLNFNNKDNTNSINPKSSEGYIVTFIHVDGSIPNNWSWTAGNYSWCYGDGSLSNPYIIENVIIDGSGREFGILINNSKNEYFIVRNCTIYKTGFGWTDGAIKLVNVSIGNIINNNCSFNVGSGIVLDTNCNNNTISGNTLNDNGPDTMGIYLSLSDNNTISENTANNNPNSGIYLGRSDYNTISGNTLKGNDYGLWSWDSDNNDITGNTANGNLVIGLGGEQSENNTVSGNIANYNDYAIYEQGGLYNIFSGNIANFNQYNGIYTYRSNFTTISNNTVNGNVIGIELDGGGGVYWGNDIITKNIIYNNSQGLYIDNFYENNLIYQNFFLNNTKHAVDDGDNNKWNSTTIGNYWDNWTSPDAAPLDGIVDDPYTFIGGTTGGTDYLPIAEDGAPRITIYSPTPDDLYGAIAPSFDVEITDIYVFERWYTIDGGVNNYTFTENDIINQTAWDGMDDGTITLTFYTSDIIYQYFHNFTHISSAEVDIIKDTIAPNIIINSPIEGERFGKTAPFFNITVTDDNLDAMWYSFDGGLITFAITNNTMLNQTAWTALVQGNVTITFYASDLVGNEASESVTVIKSVPSGLDPGMIITIIVVSIVGVVAVISVVYIFMKQRATPA